VQQARDHEVRLATAAARKRGALERMLELVNRLAVVRQPGHRLARRDDLLHRSLDASIHSDHPQGNV
jgi:hypothetical protein